MTEPLISVNQLYRHYQLTERGPGFSGALQRLLRPRVRLVQALRGISFQITRGEVVGLIGPNGAGKSTTIKILTGVLTPSSGSVRVLGLTPHKNRQKIASQIGAMFGQRTQLWWDLSPLDGFQMLQHIYEIPAEKYRRNLDTYVDLLGIESFLTQPVRKLSLGQRVRADLAGVLLHDPVLLFLDEPMIGLDILVKDRVLSRSPTSDGALIFRGADGAAKMHLLIMQLR